MFYYCQL